MPGRAGFEIFDMKFYDILWFCLLLSIVFPVCSCWWFDTIACYMFPVLFMIILLFMISFMIWFCFAAWLLARCCFWLFLLFVVACL